MGLSRKPGCTRLQTDRIVLERHSGGIRGEQALRLSEFRALREQWDRAGSQKERLQACIENTLENRDVLARGGCPFGTLCSELHKEGGSLAEKSTALFGEPLAWIEDQFRADGHGDESRGFAIHLLSALQGDSVLSLGAREPALRAIQTRRLQDWIRAL